MTWCSLICIWCRCSVCGVLFCDYVMVMTASLMEGLPYLAVGTVYYTISTFANPRLVCVMPGLVTSNIQLVPLSHEIDITLSRPSITLSSWLVLCQQGDDKLRR